MARVNINRRGLSLWMNGNIPKSVGAEMERARKTMESEVKNNVPVDTGNLKGSVRSQQTRTGNYNTRFDVIAGADYSRYVDEGTGPQHVDAYGRPAPRSAYFPNPLKFIPWAARKGIQTFIIVSNIAKRGTAPTSFRKKAFEEASRRHPGLFGRRVR